MTCSMPWSLGILNVSGWNGLGLCSAMSIGTSTRPCCGRLDLREGSDGFDDSVRKLDWSWISWVDG